MESLKIKKMFHKIKTFFRNSMNSKKIGKRDSDIDSGIDSDILSKVSPKSSEDEFIEAMSKCSIKENSLKPSENQKVLQNTTSNSLDLINSKMLKNNAENAEIQKTPNLNESSKINDGLITIQIKIKKNKSSKHKGDKKNENEKENINTVTDVDKLNESLLQLNLSNKTVDQPKRNNKDKIDAILENVHNKNDFSNKSVKNKTSKEEEKKEKKKIVYCARGPQENLDFLLSIESSFVERVDNTLTEDEKKAIEKIEKTLIQDTERFLPTQQNSNQQLAIMETIQPNTPTNHIHRRELSPPHSYEENNINISNPSPGYFSEGYYSETSNNSPSENPTWLPNISSPDSVISETDPYLNNSYRTMNKSHAFPIKEYFKSSFDQLHENFKDNIIRDVHNIHKDRLIDIFNGFLSGCNEPQNEFFLPLLFVFCERLLQRQETMKIFFEVYSNGHTVLDRAVRQCSQYSIVGNYLAECMLRALLEFKDIPSRFLAVSFTRRNSNSNTILHRVAKDGDKYSSLLNDIFLLNSFSDSPVENMNGLDSDGYAPLHIACRPSQHTMKTYNEKQICSCLQTVRKFLENNADPNIKSSKSGDTPLHSAIDWSDCAVNLVELLLQYGADPSIKNYSGKTPRSKATENFKKNSNRKLKKNTTVVEPITIK